MLTEELHWPLFARGRTRDVDAASGICPPARWNPEIQEPTEFRLPAPPAAACSSASVPGKRRTSTVESSGSAPGAISIAEHTQNTPRELPDTQTGWSHLWWARVGPACPNFFLRRGGADSALLVLPRHRGQKISWNACHPTASLAFRFHKIPCRPGICPGPLLEEFIRRSQTRIHPQSAGDPSPFPFSISLSTPEAPSTPATMSKQHCRMLQEEDSFDEVENVASTLLPVASTLLQVWTGL